MKTGYLRLMIIIILWSIATICNAESTPITNKNADLQQWFYLIMFSSLGAFVLYCKLRSDKQQVICFIDHLVPTWNAACRPCIEALLFAIIGGIVAYGLVQPSTPPQALSAGLGWTGLITAFSNTKENVRQ